VTKPNGVHPVADLFPMLSADELSDLAEDIKERGLLHPIVLDGDARILDGRNRLAACEMAGVKPVFVTYDGDDADGYALSVNTQRRNLTKGQRAMLIVKSGLFPQETDSDDDSKISKTMISKARIVGRFAPALVDAIISGADQLNRAYEFAQTEKDKSEGIEAQLARLRAEDSELADKVVEGELTLPGAFAELRERERKRADEKRDAHALLGRILELAAPQSMSDGFVESWAERLGDLDDDLIKRAEQAGQVLLDLAERFKR
jgi:ParB-like chromosome segregation protein Spo0J